tara:strand:+ start:1339 stop:1644 length:306 start_codon:yes stop_codon:yes gene_type:complete
MGQYTDKVMEYMEIMEYIEHGNQLSALEAGSGRMTKYFNHGGTEIEFLRDVEDYNGEMYKKGDTIISEATDDLYIQYNNEYNNVTPLFDSIRKAFSSIKNE